MQIRVSTNINRVAGNYIKLDSNLNKNADEIAQELANFVQKSAKLRAPRATGTLASNIKIKKKGPKSFEVGVYGASRYYAIWQERGFKPHWIPLQYVEEHYGTPGKKGQDTRTYGEKPKGWVLAYQKKGPFIKPAIEAAIKKMPDIASKFINKSIKKVSTT